MSKIRFFRFVLLALLVALFGACAEFQSHPPQVERFLIAPGLAPNAVGTFASQAVTNPFYGGGLQMAAFLTQEVESVPEELLTETIKKDWEYQTKGKCPLPEQVFEVTQKWRAYERTLKKQGKKVVIVKPVGYAAFKLDAPGLEILKAFIKAAGMVGSAAVFGASMPGMEVNQSQVGGGAKVGPITNTQSQAQTQTNTQTQTQTGP